MTDKNKELDLDKLTRYAPDRSGLNMEACYDGMYVLLSDVQDAIYDARRATPSPSASEQGGRAWTRDEVLDLMMKNCLLTEVGHKALLNGDSAQVNLDFFSLFADKVRRAAIAPPIEQQDHSARSLELVGQQAAAPEETINSDKFRKLLYAFASEVFSVVPGSKPSQEKAFKELVDHIDSRPAAPAIGQAKAGGKDAARLDFIERGHLVLDPCESEDDSRCYEVNEILGDKDDDSKRTLGSGITARAAIDAAMSATQASETAPADGGAA